MAEPDQAFYDRANAYIRLANSQCDGTVGIGRISAAFVYGLARFNSWVNATEYESGAEMKAARDATIETLLAQYRDILERHMDDHIENFDALMTPPTS